MRRICFIILTLCLLLSTACGSSSTGDKLIGKWTGKYGFVAEIQKDDKGYIYSVGDENNAKDKIRTNGKWDEESKRIIFKEDDKLSYVGYDKETDELLRYFKDGTFERYQRNK